MVEPPIHPNAVVLPPPFKVNGFIRFCRYAALFGGITWGWMRQKQITRKHLVLREKEHKVKVEEAELHFKIKAVNNKAQLLNLAKTVGLEDTQELRRQLGIK